MHAEIIPRQEAMDFLTHLQPKWLDRVWTDGLLSNVKKRLMCNARGAGAKADLINYGLRNANGKLVAVLRIGGEHCPAGCESPNGAKTAWDGRSPGC